MKGFYTVACYDDGTLLWCEHVTNVITTPGFNALLDAALSSSVPYTATCYLGLISATGYSSPPTPSNTMASHSGWSEAGDAVAPTFAARATLTFGLAANGFIESVDAEFAFLTGGGLKGCLIVFGSAASAAIGNPSGVLLSAALFDADQAVESGNVLRVRYACGGITTTTHPTSGVVVGPVAVVVGTASGPAEVTEWNNIPALYLMQGGWIDLSQYVNNPNNAALSNFSASVTLPSGVSLDPDTGILSASGSATLGSTPGVTFSVDYAAVEHPTTSALSGSSSTLTGYTSRYHAGSGNFTAFERPLASYSTAFANSKHLCFAYVDGRHYKMTGDHALIDPYGSASARQEIISVAISTNDWQLDQHYYLRSGDNLGTMQVAYPDDAFCIARGSTPPEIWVFISARVLSDPAQATTAAVTAAARSAYGTDIVTQEMEHLCIWTPSTKTWRIGGSPPLHCSGINAINPAINPPETGGDNAWRGIWDATTDRFYIPTTAGIVVIRCSDGADISPRYGDYHLLTFPDVNGRTLNFHAAGIFQEGRTAYVFDLNYGAIYSFDLDAGFVAPYYFQFTKLVDIPDGIWTGEGISTFMIFHPVKRVLVVFTNNVNPAIRGKMHLYNLNTSTLTSYDRPDNWVTSTGENIGGNTFFYDPVTQDICSMGSIDHWGADRYDEATGLPVDRVPPRPTEFYNNYFRITLT